MMRHAHFAATLVTRRVLLVMRRGLVQLAALRGLRRDLLACGGEVGHAVGFAHELALSRARAHRRSPSNNNDDDSDRRRRHKRMSHYALSVFRIATGKTWESFLSAIGQFDGVVGLNHGRHASRNERSD